jgi:hypothetical protein
MIKMSKSQAKLFSQRWERVRLRQLKELRKTPFALKFRQLNQLMSSTSLFKKDSQRAKRDINVVRNRWVKLRTAFGDHA